MTSERSILLRRLLTIAFPMVVSQASDTIMLFVDRLFLSRLGEAYLSAAMSGGLTQFMVSSLFIGTVGYTTALTAQLFGAKRRERCARAAVQGVFLSLTVYPVILAVSPLARYLFMLAGQTERQVLLSDQYFRVLIFGSVFLLLRHALSGFFLGIGRTRVVMIANLTGMLINIPANYVLIYGKLGLPALGLRGAALGTILGSLTMCAILFAFYLRAENRREFATHRSFHIDSQSMKALVRYGLPAGLELFLNIAALNLFVQFMYSYGTSVAAAVTISFNWDIVAFIPMLGMSHAVTALVGQCIGAKDYTAARKATYLSLQVTWAYSGSMVIIFLTATPVLVGVFASGFGNEGPAIAHMATILLRLAALYVLADSAQLVFAGALRGAGDTRYVMFISVGFHWGFTIVAVILIGGLRVSHITAWISFILFIVLLGVGMFLRFRSGHWQKIRVIE